MVLWYNMIPNLLWSCLNLIPVSVFCYTILAHNIFYIFWTVSLLTVLLPRSFFDNIRLGKTTLIYHKIGIRYINRFTQNGDIVNRLIRRKVPNYKVIQTGLKSADGLLKQAYMFEKFHFIMFVFFSLTAIYAIMKNYLLWSLIISMTNLLYNIYPFFCSNISGSGL